MDPVATPAVSAEHTLPGTATNGRVEKVLERFARAKAVWDYHVSLWQDCYDYTLPQRVGFRGFAPGENRTSRLFDSTAVIALQEFASKLGATMMPPFMRWIDLRAGSQIPPRLRAEANEALASVTEYLFEVLNNSNFSHEASDALTEVGIGTGCLVMEDAGPDQLIRTTAVPLTDFVLANGPFGEVDACFRVHHPKAREIEIEWPGAKIPQELRKIIDDRPEETVEIISATYRDWSRPFEEVNEFCVIWSKGKAELLSRTFEGLGSNPWIPFRWSKASKEIYGRGPVINALSDIKSCNLTIELIFQNAEIAIAGMWQYDDDGVVNPDTVTLEPGTLIARRMGSKGLEPLDAPGDFNVADMILSDIRQNIKRALYVGEFAPLDKTPMSATEVALRQQDLAQRIGAAWGRLQNELVDRVVRRAVYLLRRQGRIEIPRVDNREVKILPLSPLARAQREADILSVDRFLEQIGMRFGPQMVNLVVKPEEAARILANLHNVPPSIVRSPAEQHQLVAALSQLAAQPSPGGNPRIAA